MNRSSPVHWGDRLPRLSLALLVAAAAYGLYAGAAVTMYYDITPDMGSVEDRLGAPLLILYLLAVVVGLLQLPLAVSDLRLNGWKRASLRALVILGPLIVFLGAEGLLSHFLWWSPISNTGRHHILHHSLVAGVPLTLGYWLLVRRWQRPAATSAAPAITRRAWLVGGIGAMMLLLPLGILLGTLSPTVVGVAFALGLVALLVLWRVGR